MSKKGPEESHGEKVPLWIISFADMITLLLSFFVMLQTMATAQDARLMGASRESFRRAIAGLGMPDFLFGDPPGLGFDYRKVKYPVAEPAEEPATPRNRIIDADDEQIRMVFEDIRKKMETQTSDHAEEITSVIATPVQFEGGELNKSSQEFLSGLARNLQQDGRQVKRRIYVIGLSTEGTAKQQWLESARRAKTAAAFLAGRLSDKQWELVPWGCGQGNSRLASMGATGNTCILIAIAEVRKDNG